MSLVNASDLAGELKTSYESAIQQSYFERNRFSDGMILELDPDAGDCVVAVLLTDGGDHKQFVPIFAPTKVYTKNGRVLEGDELKYQLRDSNAWSYRYPLYRKNLIGGYAQGEDGAYVGVLANEPKDDKSITYLGEGNNRYVRFNGKIQIHCRQSDKNFVDTLNDLIEQFGVKVGSGSSAHKVLRMEVHTYTFIKSVNGQVTGRGTTLLRLEPYTKVELPKP